MTYNVSNGSLNPAIRGVVPLTALRHVPPSIATVVLIGLYFLKCTRFDQLILRKIIKIVATRCQILTLKCTKIDFGWGSAPDPAGGAYSAPPDPLAAFKGPTSKGRGREGTGGREGRAGQGRGLEGRGLLLRGGRWREERGREGTGGREGRISPYQSTFASGAHDQHSVIDDTVVIW